MAAALTLYRSTIGKKTIMAITGLIGIGFVFAHMIGNLKMFLGATAFNDYAAFLRTFGEPVLPYSTVLWIFRIVLLASVVLHMMSAYQLTRMDLASRPVRYVRKKDVQATFASRTMRWGGVILLLFIIYHLLDLTLGVVHPNFQEGMAYQNFVADFQPSRWFVTIFYTLAIAALSFHVYHGFWSLFQTLGLNNRTYNQLLRVLAIVIALVLLFGFLAAPFAVMFGIIS